ncbi:potassium channel subfamily K member 17 isoform X1 [Folsomia candida]|uniref:potassium channel subfamily K member 17 isoform X1 n=1 Tax=Folsomia candida TaxID=158441 RepID=UPI0016053D1B|nr:potassium channel subfamily K member 17 isoform X1 [Folsomia candida]
MESGEVVNQNTCNQESRPDFYTRVKPYASTALLLVGLLVYNGIGALIFQQLEGPASLERRTAYKNLLLEGRSNLIHTVVTRTQEGNDLNSTLSSALEAYDNLIDDVKWEGMSVVKLEVTSEWSYLRSFFFATTVLTTIGYGNMTPKTKAGRTFCIFFAVLGIPLTVTVIADLGKLIASAVSYACKGCGGRAPPEVVKSSSKLRKLFGKGVTAGTVVFFLFIYISAGSWLYTYLENWSFFDSFYFCFITVTTIGFGDVVPSRLQYLLLCSVYFIVGLALCSTAFELVRTQYSDSWKKMQALSSHLSAPLAETLKKCGDNIHHNLDACVMQELLDLRKALGISGEGVGDVSKKVASKKCGGKNSAEEGVNPSRDEMVVTSYESTL